MRRQVLTFVLPSLVLALTASTSEPGGWAVTTVENLPDRLVAGASYDLAYSVRQHGLTLKSGLAGKVSASSGDEVVEATARPGEGEGEYRAELTVPRPGLWTVTIRTEIVPGMPNFTSESKLVPIEAVVEGGKPQIPISELERGRRLFVAKGCMTCHVHRAVAGSGTIPYGPDLSERQYEAAYLAMYLADPTIRPPTQQQTFPMPNLHLDRAEIVGLTAFINADERWRNVRGAPGGKR